MKRIVKDLTKLEKVAEVIAVSKNGIVNKVEIEDILAELKKVMEAKPELIALAAPQIGINKRIFCIRFEDVIKYFINPVITKKKGLVYSVETFINKPNFEYFIGRPAEITAVYYNENIKYEDNKFLAPVSKIFEQQCQLLDGILPNVCGMEFAIEDNISLKDAPEEILEVIAKSYGEWSKKRVEEIENSIKEDPELVKVYKKLKFTEDIINGHAQIITEEEKVEQKADPRVNVAIDKIKRAENRARIAAIVNKKKHRKGK